MRKLLLITGLLFISALFYGAKALDLKANAASMDITPPLSMKYTLGGYGERMNKPATAIHDRIWAKALVLKEGNRKYAIITLDILGLPSNVKPDLIKRISQSGWSADNILLLPSHSHGSLEMAALNSKNLLNIPQLGIYQPELLEFLLSKLEALVKKADQNHQPVTIATKNKEIEGLNRNRRKDPDVDKELIVTRVDLKNGKTLAVLVNWTAHPTFIGGKDMQVSAEWPGYLQSELQDRIGGGVVAMYYNGSEGDQSPVLKEQVTDDYQKIEIYGKKMASLAYDLFKEIKTEPIRSFNYNYKTLQLPEHKAHPTFMKTGGSEYGMNENSVKVVMNVLCPTTTGIGAIQLGDLMIVGVPGEMTAVLGLNIKQTLHQAGVKYVAIGGLANEWISYILNKDQYLHGEGYESSVSFYGENLGQFLSDAILKNAIGLSRNN